jgi:D-alanyl-lipoteichoic acid acyltransferase DltB (MBOAT superfamily)
MRRFLLLIVSVIVLALLCRSIMWPLVFLAFSAVNYLFLSFYRRKWFFPLVLFQLLPLFYIRFAPWGIWPLPFLATTFYVLLSLSFLFDLAEGKIKNFPAIWDYFLYVIYFPKFFFGPADRFNDFSAEVKKNTPPKWKLGLFLITSGVMKKFILIAGPAALTSAFFREQPTSGSATLMVLYLCMIEYYSVFSGYTDLVRGISYLLGIKLPINFRLPFLSLNPLEYWQRWHISFSLWLRDYVFYGIFFRIKALLPAVFLTFVIMGLFLGYRFESKFLYLGVFCGIVTTLYVAMAPALARWQLKFSPPVRTAYRIAAWVLMIHFMAVMAFFHRIEKPEYLLLSLRSLLSFSWGVPENKLIFSALLLTLPLLFSGLISWRRSAEEENFSGVDCMVMAGVLLLFGGASLYFYGSISSEMFQYLLYRKS